MPEQPRRQRLSRSADFGRVYRHGRSSQHRLLVVYRFERPDDVRGTDGDGAFRLGITVSRKLGGAVERNRLKRQLREAFLRCDVATEGIDYVLIARPGLAEAVEREGFEWLVGQLAELVAKASSAPARER